MTSRTSASGRAVAGSVSQVIAANVRRLRKSQEMTQAGLSRAMQTHAEELGLEPAPTRIVVVKIEDGTRPARMEEVVLLCAALGVTMGDLLEGIDSRIGDLLASTAEPAEADCCDGLSRRVEALESVDVRRVVRDEVRAMVGGAP